MPFRHPPAGYCSGQWPTGPFRTPEGEEPEPGAVVAATAVASVVAALVRRRTGRSWSRAELSRRASIGQHTIGRIEAGTAWPDLATIARLAKVLNLEVTVALPGVTARPAPAPEPVVRGAPLAGPLDVDLSGLAEPTAAHVIEAILHNSPRMRGQVEDLRRQRSARAAPTIR